MNFEHALEAMKQGKKAGRRAWTDWDKSKMIFLKGNYFYWVGEEDIGVALTLDFLEADDWEIYEEPLKEPEHKCNACHCKGSEAGTHMRNLLMKLSAPTEDAKKLFDKLGVSVFDDAGNMKSLEDVFGELQTAFAGMNNPAGEKKISDLQVEMKQIFSRKFFELADTTTDSLAVSNMIEIYRLLFEVE